MPSHGGSYYEGFGDWGDEGDYCYDSEHESRESGSESFDSEVKKSIDRWKLVMESDSSDEQDDCDVSESDSDGGMGVRALAFDPNQLSNAEGLPVNGHDYLKMVQEERQGLPAVVTVPVPVPTSAKKSTQNSTIPMEVLHCDEEMNEKQDNFILSQQSSLHPMDTSILRESHISSASSSSSLEMDEENPQPELDNDYANSGMTLKEYKKQLRLKKIGCVPLCTERKLSPQSRSLSQSGRELVHRDEILTNFLKLRAEIDNVREKNRSEVDDLEIEAENDETKQQKSSKRADKNLSRCDRRAASLIRVMNLGHPPQLNSLVNKSQRVIHSTLERIADQSEKAPIYSTLHADWIYSLIALLRDPIEPDICSTLRRLAKLCITRRDNYERRLSDVSQPSTAAGPSNELVEAINAEEYYACLLIICIVRYHFGQNDLK